MARTLIRADLEDELLKAFEGAFPEVAKQHIEALNGHRGPAGAILGLSAHEGGTVLSEYTFGDVHAVLEDVGRFRKVFPLGESRRSGEPR